MRVKKNKRVNFFGLIIASMIVVFFPFNFSQAANVSFGQSILPVKFVYLDARGVVEKVWSNVSDKDSAYVVKFFDAREKTEFSGAPEFLGKYLSYAESQPQCEFFSGGKINRIVEYAQSGGALEEIQTIV